MKIAFFELKPWEEVYLKKRLKGHSLQFFEEPLSQEHIKKIKNVDAITVFIYSKVNKAILAKLPKLKLLCTKSTGFDHIDLAACKAKHIMVCNVPFYGENTVAEHTFALILSLSRNIHKSYIRTIRNDFTIEGLKGFDLKGKTIGVIGGGRIGLHVIRMAKAFAMNILVFDLHRDEFLAEVLRFKYSDLDTIYEKSDIITLHVPYNMHTHHMINKEAFKKMKNKPVLINTARGGIIDTDAMIEALDKGYISGAGLDVMEGEDLIKEEKQLLHDPSKRESLGQLIKDHILLSKDNVVFTPHLAFYSQEALERILKTTIDNIDSFCNKHPVNIVNLR